MIDPAGAGFQSVRTGDVDEPHGLKTRATRGDRGIILPVVLVMIGLLALTMAGFIFFVRAETMGVMAQKDAQQAQLAADSGFEEIVAVLRTDRHNAKAWFDVPDRWRHALVWGSGFTREGDPVRKTGSRAEYLSRGQVAEAWRYSVVAEQFDGPEGTLRFGITPETSKLNLNTATDEQLSRLFTPLLLEMGLENAADIVNAILDWRDGDSTTRQGGAENDYYNTLRPPFNAKNNRFDTVEELLLVKGVTAAILFGEDVNRNGILDSNEDDGETTYPVYDNADGVLNRGIAPFLTVFARDIETALDNKPRINLLADPGYIAAQIATQLPEGALSAATIAFISNLRGAGINPALLRSPADLLAPTEDETVESMFGTITTPQPGETPSKPGEKGEKVVPTAEEAGEEKKDGAEKRIEQDRDEGKGPADGGKGPTDGKGPKDGKGPQNSPGAGPAAIPGRTGGGRGADGAGSGDGGGPAAQPDGRGGRSGRGGRGGRGGSGSATPQSTFQALRASPVTLEELPVLMDRFTTRPPDQMLVEDRVNLNTAPLRVLQVVRNMTPAAAAAIVTARGALDPTVAATTAWPLTTGAVDAATFKSVAPFLTAKAYQFRVEIVGYADHSKASRRYEWIIEMVGPLPQVKYHRELSSLGQAWPIDRETVVVTGP
jgi:type II secretory pathway component PulK